MADTSTPQILIGVNPNQVPDKASFSATDEIFIMDNNGNLLYKGQIGKILDSVGIEMSSSFEGIIETASDVPPTIVAPAKVFQFAGPGTYTNYKDASGTAITTTAPLNVISWDGTAASVLGIDIPLDDYQAKATLADDVAAAGFAQTGGSLSTVAEIEEKVQATADNLDQITIESGNQLLDSNAVVGALFTTTATPSASANWLAYTLDISDLGIIGEKITISGRGLINGTHNAFMYIGADNSVLNETVGNNAVSQTSDEIPEGTVKIAMNLANIIGIGNTPTNNVYSNTLMVNVGDTALPYEPYGNVSVNSDTIAGLQDKITNNSSVLSAKTFTDSVKYVSKNISNKAAYLGGSVLSTGAFSASNNWCSTDYEPCVAGTVYTSSGHFTAANSSLAVAWYDQNKVFISGTALTGAVTYTATAPATAAFSRRTICNVVNYGLTPTNNQYVNAFMVNVGDTALPYEPYDPGAKIDANSIVGLQDAINNPYPKFIVKFTPYTGTYSGTLISQEIVQVYENLKSNIYVKHSILYEKLAYGDYVSGDFHGGEVVRYAGSKLFGFNLDSRTFSDLDQTVTITPENEFVISDGSWSSGYHGNEDLSSVVFLINNVPYNDGTVYFPASDLIYCDSVSYLQLSVLKLDSDKSSLATKKKNVEFKNGGYKVNVKLKWLQAASVLVYAAVVCVGKMFTKLVTDSSVLLFPNGTGGTDYMLDHDYMGRKGYYSNGDYKLSVTNTVFNNEIDLLAFLRIWDRTTDTKFYRGIENLTVAVNDYFETTTTVELTAD